MTCEEKMQGIKDRLEGRRRDWLTCEEKMQGIRDWLEGRRRDWLE